MLRFFVVAALSLATAFVTIVAPAKAEAERSWPGIFAMEIGGRAIEVEVAATGRERAKGLSGRPDLPADRGLLFVFPDNGAHGIWMKDMRFAIDIVWISEDLKVVHLAEDVSPATFPAVFSPPQPARYVLELTAASARRLGIEIGKNVKMPAELDN